MNSTSTITISEITDKLFYLLLPQFPHLKKGENHELLGGKNWKKKGESTLRFFFLNLKILRNRMYYLMIVMAETCAFSYFLILTFLFSSICLIGIVDVCLISRNCQLLMLWLKSIAKLTKSKEQVQRDLQNK